MAVLITAASCGGWPSAVAWSALFLAGAACYIAYRFTGGNK